VAQEIAKLLKADFPQAAKRKLRLKEISQKKYHQIANYQIIKSVEKPNQVTYKIGSTNS